MDRRQIISRLPLLGAALALPAVAQAAPATVPAFDLQGWLDTVRREDVALYHLTQLTIAMQAIKGGQWQGTIDVEKRFALVNLWDETKAGVFIRPNGA